ncbi:MAG: chloride channel protein [Deltaproteobacteria bacterium]|nr:chloride channel protein [Deltaproteobacteria bacterium]
MKRKLKEEIIIFISVIKWVVLASITGAVVGVSTTVFVKSLNRGASLNLVRYYYLSIPAGLLLSWLIIRYIAPEAEGHGTNKAIEAVHKESGKIRPIASVVEFIRTLITISSGGSAGKEGPSAQIGAGMASMFADILRFEGPDRRKLVICGISGGFASVFGAPLAGAIFGLEALFVGTIIYDVLLPSFVAGIISYQVSSRLGLTYFYRPITLVPVFSQGFFIKVIVAGVFFGLVSFLFIEILAIFKKLSSALKSPMWLKCVAAGAALAVITFIFTGRYLGLGLDVIQSAIEGEHVPWYAFILKSITTGITLYFGGSGGKITPAGFVGSTAGSALSRIINMDPAMLSAIGFVSLLAGAANTPIAASIMSIELFGPEVAPYAAISCVISYIITGHRSIYPSQVLAAKKSSSINVEVGSEMEKLSPDYLDREKSLTGTLIRIWQRLSKR